MRVLLLNWRDLAHPRSGGAEVFTHEVLTRWARDGHEVTMFVAEVLGQPSREVVDGIEIVRRGSRVGVYREARLFFEQTRSRFDIVIDEINTRPFGAPSFAGDTPVMALAHQVAREVWFAELPWPVAALGARVLEPRWLHRYRYVPTVTISESSRVSLEEYGLQRVAVVTPPGGPERDLERLSPKEAVPTVVFVGRLAANKRPDHAVEAFGEVRRRLPNAQLWVVGDGELHDRLARRREPGVTLFGRVDHDTKLDLMRRAHLLVATSVREGWGMVVDEAAAVGTPTVGYDVAGLRDSITRAGGVLVEPSPAALAQRVAALLPELVENPSKLLALRLDRTWDDVAVEMFDVVRQVTRSACANLAGAVAL